MHVNTTTTLTEREETFVMALARGVRPTPAAIAAGWSGGSTRALLRRPHITAAIRKVAANLARTVQAIDRAA